MRNKLLMATLAIATPALIVPIQAHAFQDVPKTHAGYNEIMAMKKEGIINGYLDGTFKPEQGISRQHVAKLLSHVLPLEPIRPATTFTDVPTNHPYYNDIQRLYRAGIIDGFEGKFNPTGALTHAQIAKILCLAFQFELVQGEGTHWSKDYVATLYARGIMTGDWQRDATVTRAHYAIWLYRILNIEQEETPSLIPAPIEIDPPVYIQEASAPKIKLRFNNEEVLVKLEQNAATQDLIAALPLTLTFEDYAGTEKISYLPKKLSTTATGAGIDPAIGDLAYYAPWGNLALFYQDFGYSSGLIKLGEVEAGLEKLAKMQGKFTVTIERVEEK